jgi:hypothetical protein
VAALDRLREELVYLRFWLGITVVTTVSVVGWLISSTESASPRLLFMAMIGIIPLSVGIYLLHRQIERKIKQAGRL